MVGSPNSQDYVVVRPKTTMMLVENGKSFRILVDLRAATGIHVNSRPPVSVKSLDDKITATVGTMPDSGEYMDVSKPIEIDCTMNGLPAGRHLARFVIGFTFCSVDAGWCRMGDDTVSITLKVKK